MEKVKRFLKRELCLGNVLILVNVYAVYYVLTTGVFTHPNRNLALICGLLFTLVLLVGTKIERQYTRGK